jgi:hypothetical protein
MLEKIPKKMMLMMKNRPQTLTRMIQKLLERATIPTKLTMTKIMATMEMKMTLPITQMETNLQKLTQVVEKMIIFLNLKTMVQANQVTQVAAIMTLPKTRALLYF